MDEQEDDMLDDEMEPGEDDLDMGDDEDEDPLEEGVEGEMDKHGFHEEEEEETY